MSTQYATTEWFTLPEAAAELGVSSGRLHRLREERFLLAVKHDGQPRIPKDFIRDGEPLAGLRGTLTLLADHGVVDHEAMEWLLSVDESLGMTPTQALQEGRKSSVRRSVQLLAI
ncbi:Rv2175c family DNA-binding protein [Gulosibacter sp. 10]|uniref:Rv2175c family DNA-binding protein n=1 Tax=Gulosibacter sp. 10 TaxID=1255570 RepID=UPI00097F1F20|nr:Rv2175c family DNA-binding protein [Gulosibacter sp. 10]SJM65433.1 putative transcriptional regulatory protein [Gulosibacter sp. 10]